MSKDQEYLKTLLDKIDDLILQATKERSHYYVASVLKECKQVIDKFSSKPKFVRDVEGIKDIIKSLAISAYNIGINGEPFSGTKKWRSKALEQIGSLPLTLPKNNKNELVELDEEKVAKLLFEIDCPHSSLKWQDLKYDIRNKYIIKSQFVCSKFGVKQLTLPKGILPIHLKTWAESLRFELGYNSQLVNTLEYIADNFLSKPKKNNNE